MLEDLDDPGTALELSLRRLVELGSELCERLELAELREVKTQPSRHLLHRLDLRVATYPANRDAYVDRRPDPREEEIAFEIDLAVGDRDHVGRNVGRHVTALGFDDGKRGERSSAVFVRKLRGPLEQAGVQIEDVARVGLSSRGPTQQQRQLAVCDRLLGQVVVDDEGVLAVLHPVLAHGATGIGREVLEGSGIGRRGIDHDGVLEGTGFLERRHDLGDRGRLLTHSNVDALHLPVGAPQQALVDDRVDGDGRAAGLPVANDELALPAADRRHRVDRLDAGLKRLLDRLTSGDARGLDLELPPVARLDRALSVDGIAEPVDDTPEELVAYTDGEDLTGLLHRVALLDVGDVAQDDATDLLLFEVHREPDDAAGKLEHLVRHRPREPTHSCDAVADLLDTPHFLALEGRAELLDVPPEYRGDILWADREYRFLCHLASSHLLSELLQLVPDASIDDCVSYLCNHPAQYGGVDQDLDLDRLARSFAEGQGQLTALTVVERNRAADLGYHGVAGLRRDVAELLQYLGELTTAALGHDEAQQPEGMRRDLVPKELLEHFRTLGPIDGLVREHLPQLIFGLEQLAEAVQLILDLVELAFGLNYPEERLRVSVNELPRCHRQPLDPLLPSPELIALTSRM